MLLKEHSRQKSPIKKPYVPSTEPYNPSKEPILSISCMYRRGNTHHFRCFNNRAGEPLAPHPLHCRPPHNWAREPILRVGLALMPQVLLALAASLAAVAGPPAPSTRGAPAGDNASRTDYRWRHDDDAIDC